MIDRERIAKALYEEYCRGRGWNNDRWEDEPAKLEAPTREQYYEYGLHLMSGKWDEWK